MNVFDLMLENRSFDHLLGFSGLTGTESNSYGGTRFTVMAGADEAMPLDPGHEFPDVLEQLAGTGATYVSGRYPPINNRGYVSNYVDSHTSGEGAATTNFGEILRCFSAAQLPVLNALTREFAVLRQLALRHPRADLAKPPVRLRRLVQWLGPQSNDRRNPHLGEPGRHDV